MIRPTVREMVRDAAISLSLSNVIFSLKSMNKYICAGKISSVTEEFVSILLFYMV